MVSKPAAESGKSSKKTKIWSTVAGWVSHIVAIPVFLILHKRLPDPDWAFHLDRILLFLAVFFLLEMLFKSFEQVVKIGFLLSVLWLGYGSITGGYGFRNLYTDYRSMLFSMNDSPHPEEIFISRLKPFKDRTAITDAIDYDNPEVRNFALSLTRIYFTEEQRSDHYRTIVQCFAAFKEINTRWNYVSDPKSREYYAKASESLQHLSGDCDDHSILMAACIKAVGGVPRLVHTSGHLYPELLIGDRNDLEQIHYLIKRHLFKTESRNQKLYYHIDEYDQIWLNLDYTAKYPGGPFMNETIIGTLTLD